MLNEHLTEYMIHECGAICDKQLYPSWDCMCFVLIFASFFFAHRAVHCLWSIQWKISHIFTSIACFYIVRIFCCCCHFMLSYSDFFGIYIYLFKLIWLRIGLVKRKWKISETFGDSVRVSRYYRKSELQKNQSKFLLHKHS